MSLDNPHTIPPEIDLHKKHTHKCEVCDNEYECLIFCEKGDRHRCNDCELEIGKG